MMPNRLVFSTEGNTELQEVLAKLTPGDEIELNVTCTLDEATPKQASLSVKDVEVCDSSDPSEPSESPSEEGESLGEDKSAGAGENPAAMFLSSKPSPGSKT